MGQIGLSRNLKRCIVPDILPVTRVIRQDGQTAAISIVSHETRSCTEIDNAHYLVRSLRTNSVALQYGDICGSFFIFLQCILYFASPVCRLMYREDSSEYLLSRILVPLRYVVITAVVVLLRIVLCFMYYYVLLIVLVFDSVVHLNSG